jgi:hypothetical protein
MYQADTNKNKFRKKQVQHWFQRPPGVSLPGIVCEQGHWDLFKRIFKTPSVSHLRIASAVKTPG